MFAREGVALCGPLHDCVILPVQRHIRISLNDEPETAAKAMSPREGLCLFIYQNEQDCIRSAQTVDDAGVIVPSIWRAVSLSISDTIG